MNGSTNILFRGRVVSGCRSDIDGGRYEVALARKAAATGTVRTVTLGARTMAP